MNALGVAKRGLILALISSTFAVPTAALAGPQTQSPNGSLQAAGSVTDQYNGGGTVENVVQPNQDIPQDPELPVIPDVPPLPDPPYTHNPQQPTQPSSQPNQPLEVTPAPSPQTPNTSEPTHSSAAGDGSGGNGKSDYTIDPIRVKLLSDGSLNVSARCNTSELTICYGRVRISTSSGTVIGRDTFRIISGRDVWIHVDITRRGKEFLRSQSSPRVRVNLVAQANASAASGRSMNLSKRVSKTRTLRVKR